MRWESAGPEGSSWHHAEVPALPGCNPQGHVHAVIWLPQSLQIQTLKPDRKKEERKMKFEGKVLPVLALAILIPSLASAQYTRTDLVTNSGAGGTIQNPHLINAWGLVSTSSSPFGVSDNGTGLSTLYSISNTGGTVTTTVAGLVVSIPSAAGGQGTPT